MELTHHRALIAAAVLLASPAAHAEPPTPAQQDALHALNMEFDVHHQTGNPDEVQAAFNQACSAGYSLACQRGAWVIYGEPDLSAAAELFVSACDNEDPVACMVVGWHLDRSAPMTSERDRIWRSAAKTFRDLCDSGFTPACHDYGWFLYQNKGFEADPRTGVIRWKKACDAGDASSCATLGTLSVDGGSGIPKSAGAARRWLKKSCDAGHAEGCYQLGLLDSESWDMAQRSEWFAPHCDAGHRESCWYLSQDHLKGAYDQPDFAELDELLDRGCELGHATSCFEGGRRALSLENPDHAVAADRFAKACKLGEMSGCTSQVELITAGLIEGSVKTAPEAFETACLKRNSPAACTSLAMELMRGVDLPRDPARARALLHRACTDPESSPKACNALAASYEEGVGGERDRTTAAKFYRWACDQEHALSCESRGDLLVAGRGVTRDDHDALAMYIKACEAGLGSACNKGAVIVDEGTFVKRDTEQALSLYGKACEDGVGDGCTGMGRIYEDEAHGTPDMEAARRAYQQGVALGSVEALREQARMLWNGLGGKTKRGQARRLAAEACQSGDAIACQGAEAL